MERRVREGKESIRMLDRKTSRERDRGKEEEEEEEIITTHNPSPFLESERE